MAGGGALVGEVVTGATELDPRGGQESCNGFVEEENDSDGDTEIESSDENFHSQDGVCRGPGEDPSAGMSTEPNESHARASTHEDVPLAGVVAGAICAPLAQPGGNEGIRRDGFCPSLKPERMTPRGTDPVEPSAPEATVPDTPEETNSKAELYSPGTPSSMKLDISDHNETPDTPGEVTETRGGGRQTDPDSSCHRSLTDSSEAVGLRHPHSDSSERMGGPNRTFPSSPSRRRASPRGTGLGSGAVLHSRREELEPHHEPHHEPLVGANSPSLGQHRGSANSDPGPGLSSKPYTHNPSTLSGRCSSGGAT
ncbi:unnamed protein product, partial [Discosporangium mesarthrocarpum]